MIRLIGQILGIIAAIVSFFVYQQKTPKKTLIIQSIMIFLIIISYFMLGATAGAILNCICLIRNFVFYNKNKKIFSYKWIPYFIAFLTVVFGLMPFSWEGVHSLFVIVGLAIHCVFLSFNDNQKLRKSILLTSTLVLIYAIIVRSMGGILLESTALISAVIGLIRYRDKSLEKV